MDESTSFYCQGISNQASERPKEHVPKRLTSAAAMTYTNGFEVEGEDETPVNHLPKTMQVW